MLLDRVAEGDKVAFTELFDHYQVMVYDYSMKLTRSKSQAEEIVQDIFIKIWLKRKDIQTIENFGAYLNRATRNQCYTALRKIAADALKYVELTAQDVLSGTNAEHRLLYNESAKMLKTVVDTLPPQQKLVYELCHEQGLKYQEVADQLNISSGTVHKHMKLALKTIRTHFIEMNAMLFVLISMNK
ncbi:RNA polymerase sigma factor [Pedobacter cryoconitis]|uniref:RNA polymerase sigma-70 factor (ECF subfamily) n=1 Tax=Pedobacter cryoconitis TaxID=188932 RepID=A0A7X0MJ77_9SPHI|nr:RNA polymerase sigma-70 factor [Pedobacter cryoconitis]MBB6501182.1 RNA polymerase sigma-70 factor (ECF subfamily) [Pedobacter cryoconitis]